MEETEYELTSCIHPAYWALFFILIGFCVRGCL